MYISIIIVDAVVISSIIIIAIPTMTTLTKQYNDTQYNRNRNVGVKSQKGYPIPFYHTISLEIARTRTG